jgi:hypothetical protein
MAGSSNYAKEVMYAPAEVWIAPVGTAFPDVDEAPAGPWARLGASGIRSQSEAGVKLSFPQSMENFRGQGTAIRKFARTEEGVELEVELADATLETAVVGLNGNGITTQAAASGAPGRKGLSLARGYNVKEYAVLTRAKRTPYSVDDNAYYQVEINRASQTGTPEPEMKKDGPLMWKYKFESMEGPNATDDDANIGQIIAYTAVAL